jgi:beta-phosphoglucomutase-like phosphatase (HAD superfamily)
MIAYDFDGVLCNTMPAFQQYWQEKYSFRISANAQTEFAMPMPEGYDERGIGNDIEEAINLYQGYLQPFSFAMEMVREFAREYNEQPIIITARRKVNIEATDTWLKHYLGIPFTLVAVTGHSKKAEIVGPEWGIAHYVEDRYRTVNELAATGVKVFMPERKWNMGRPLHDSVVVVNNLLDVWDYIKKHEE